jgi:hypothetical protein
MLASLYLLQEFNITNHKIRCERSFQMGLPKVVLLLVKLSHKRAWTWDLIGLGTYGQVAAYRDHFYGWVWQTQPVLFVAYAHYLDPESNNNDPTTCYLHDLLDRLLIISCCWAERLLPPCKICLLSAMPSAVLGECVHLSPTSQQVNM